METLWHDFPQKARHLTIERRCQVLCANLTGMQAA